MELSFAIPFFLHLTNISEGSLNCARRRTGSFGGTFVWPLWSAAIYLDSVRNCTECTPLRIALGLQRSARSQMRRMNNHLPASEINGRSPTAATSSVRTSEPRCAPGALQHGCPLYGGKPGI